jgi:hypothetical protein
MGNLKTVAAGFAAKNNTPARNGFEEILQRALSLKELGLLDKAVAEYENLLKTDCPPSKIIPGMVVCLLTTLSAVRVRPGEPIKTRG